MNHRCSVMEACRPLIFNNEQLREISDLLLISIKEGLGKETHENAAVRCYQTFVQDFPTGNERGTFMALDLGGTNFRVLSVILAGKQKIELLKETYAFPDEKKHGTAEDLFDHVADCVLHFCKKHQIDIFSNLIKIPLGFTFSFPTSQLGLNQGILIKWTKGFSASGVIGKDVVTLLNEAFVRKNIGNAMFPISLLNDTTGTLMSCALENPNCRVGVICGTGHNACYTERIENIELFSGDPTKPYMIVNCEWGNFGADGKLKDFLSEYDVELIEASSHKYNQTFEKCVAGRYLGEVMRLIMMKLIKRGELFHGRVSEKLKTPYVLGTKHITQIETDSEFGPLTNTEEVCNEMEITDYDEQDLSDMYFIAKVVSSRSASWIGAAVSTVLNKMGISPVSIGVDGTVYRRHPTFSKILHTVTRLLTRPEIQFEYILSEDGSGRGAAFVAAVSAGINQ